MWIQECGLIHSILTTLPFSWTGLFASNSAANEWCALSEGAVATSSAAPAITRNSFVRTVSLLRRRYRDCWPERSLALSPRQYSHSLRLFRLLLFQVAVEQLLREFDALVLEKLDLRLQPAVERHTDRPGPDERLRVLDPRLVIEVVSAGRRGVALGDRERVTVMIAGSIKPGQIVEAVHLDHKRVAVPLAVRPPHPAVHRRLCVVDHVDGAIGAGVLVHEEDVVHSLDDLERVRHVGRPRQPRHVALGFRIRLGPSRLVLLPLLQAVRRVRDRAVVVDDHALSRRNREHGAELPERGRRGGVILEVPVGGVDGLPDAIQVRMARDSIRSRGGRRSSTPPARRCRAALTRGLLPFDIAQGIPSVSRGMRRYGQRHRGAQHDGDECVRKPVAHVPRSPYFAW